MDIPLINIPGWLEAAILFMFALWLVFFQFFVEKIWPRLEAVGQAIFTLGIVVILLILWLIIGMPIVIYSVVVVIAFLVWWVFSGFPHRKSK